MPKAERPIPDWVPAHLAALEAKPRMPAINNGNLVKDFRAKGGMVLHMRPKKRKYEDGRITRGLTVAFAVRSGRIEVATAVQHRVDCFSKKIGTKTAIEHFLAGKTVTLPLRPGNHTVENMRDALIHLV